MAKIYLRVGDKVKEAQLEAGGNILDYARRLGIPIASRCGGNGTCGECRVVVEQGGELLSARSDSEKSLGGMERLACQAEVTGTGGDLYMRVMHYGNMRVLSEGSSRKIPLDPLTKRVGGNVVFDNRRIGDYRGHIYGIAADIGTTTVVLHLMDLENGNLVSTHAFENPQRSIDGDNVIARIAYDRDNPGRLQKKLVACINREIKRMKCDAHDIFEMVVVGNSTMRDLFFGLDVQTIGIVPYKSVTELKGGSTSLNMEAKNLGLGINPLANIYGPPLIGSHVGADTVAVCLSSGIFETDKTAMAIDIGTNGEIVLRHDNVILAASCAAGGALERIPGIEGAIERISMDGRISYETIGNAKPIGICGSGIVDFLAEALRTGVMDCNGRLGNGDRFMITDGIYVESRYTAGDFLLGKAAVSLGIRALLREAGIRFDDIELVYLAGSYGNHINPLNAMRIGLIPNVDLGKIVRIGNAAASGAKEILLNMGNRGIAEDGAKKVRHVALESLDDYSDRLMDELSFMELRSA